jgi:2',3'-cyclic-nucleotide 2'-phosphodiesterase (5'-nucleotidase family)
MMVKLSILTTALLAQAAIGCEDHDWTSPIHGGYLDRALMSRHDHEKRVQPGALKTLPQQIKELHWGQINFLSTTDTHGWLAGHLLDENYSADYGDFADFVRKMKSKADVLGVDLLLVDSGDLHDGTGFGDATTPNGKLTLPIFKQLPYDLLSIGNHELYTTEIANDTYRNFAPNWGGRYVTSNVDIVDRGVRKPFSNRYAYWQTKFGVRIMSFSFLFNFTGNSNATVVTPVGTAIQQSWFLEQAKRKDIDMFLITGHITLRDSAEWNLIYRAIRAYHPNTPIQIFGGHRHIRDAVIWDAAAVGTAAGRYCETVGWASIDGLSTNVTRARSPMGPGNVKVTSSMFTNQTGGVVLNVTRRANSNLTYSRQYLDFNRPTFEKHVSSLRQGLNTSYGQGVTAQITKNVSSLPELTRLLGCSPDDFYQSYVPQTAPNNLFRYLTTTIFPGVVYAPGRNTSSYPRIILTNTGGFRYDVLKGPFTIDNAYQTNPYTNLWQYMTAPWGVAKNLLANMQTDARYRKRQSIPATTFNSSSNLYTTAGYRTTDDFGSDGDNTFHYDQGYYPTPRYVAANVSVSNISDSTLVDVYVTSYFAAAAAAYLPGNTTDWINVLNSTGGGFTSFDTIPTYARLFWSKDC